MWHQHEYPSPQHNPRLPDEPIRTLQHRERISGGTQARKPLLADAWKCDLAPWIPCWVLLPPHLLYCLWRSQKSCHDTGDPIWKGKQQILPDCNALAACLEEHQVQTSQNEWIAIIWWAVWKSLSPPISGVFFFFFAWVFVREMLKSWLYLKIIVQFSSVEKEPGFYLKNYIDATTRKQA